MKIMNHMNNMKIMNQKHNMINMININDMNLMNHMNHMDNMTFRLVPPNLEKLSFLIYRIENPRFLRLTLQARSRKFR